MSSETRKKLINAINKQIPFIRKTQFANIIDSFLFLFDKPFLLNLLLDKLKTYNSINEIVTKESVESIVNSIDDETIAIIMNIFNDVKTEANSDQNTNTYNLRKRKKNNN